jgi:hypothetical protein
MQEGVDGYVDGYMELVFSWILRRPLRNERMRILQPKLT